ncbi:MAG: TraB/GumN family protein, partial [Treponema sp.]|nr:TraB/GumN family protein [Treponema sp.]
FINPRLLKQSAVYKKIGRFMSQWGKNIRSVFSCVIIIFVLFVVACKTTAEIVKSNIEDNGKIFVDDENVDFLDSIDLIDLSNQNSKQIFIEKFDDAMLWHIYGTNSNNEKSEVFILGTYRFADQQSYPYSQKIDDVWMAADRIVFELSKDDWQDFQNKVDEKVNESLAFNTDKSLIDQLTTKELMLLISALGEQKLAFILSYEPWVAVSAISEKIMESIQLDYQKSYDVHFINKAFEENRSFEGLDELQVQVDLHGYGDWDFQLEMLHEKIRELEEIDETVKENLKVYETYLSGNAEDFKNAYFSQLYKSLNQINNYEDYLEKLVFSRNKLWATKIKDYLEQGGTTFIIAGGHHFVGDDSVLSFMGLN